MSASSEEKIPKLASLERLVKLEPIENADRLELATVLGWKCVVKKGEMKVGDWVVMALIDVEVDTTKDPFTFLKGNKDGWFRLRTIKLRGVYSQGLVLPLWGSLREKLSKLEEGANLTELLPVRKYCKPEPERRVGNSGYAPPKYESEDFPKHIVSKTDEDHVRSNPKAMAEFDGVESYISLKLDGSSLTLIFQDGNIQVCSRNLLLLSGQHDMLDFTSQMELNIPQGRNLAIQGEFVGPRINQNRLGLKDRDFFVFNIKDLDENRYLGLDAISELCSSIGLKMVPVLERFVFDAKVWTLDRLQEYANNVVNPESKSPAEGIVIRPVIPFYAPTLGKCLSLKLVSQIYKDT